MQRPLIQSLMAVLLTSCFAAAQPPATASQDATIQALLKEVHALRVALEQSNQIGPRIQIALARIQMREERVRNATRQLQDAHERLVDTQTKRAEIADRIKQIEAQQQQTVDPNARKQMDGELTEMKAVNERMNVTEQQYRAKEAEANSLLLTEQGRWNEADDMLKSIERALVPQQQ
jgi:chromosome segregation ATPase